MKINIAHLYPELLNLYGDRGNIASLTKRLIWRGIDCEVKEYELNDEIDFANTDIILLGGGSRREQLLVCKRLREFKTEFSVYVEQGGVTIAICGGYQLLGHYYRLENELVEGMSILDIFTELGKSRLIGNVVIKTDFLERPIVGFENHRGRTMINQHKPLGKLLCGNGNNGKSGFEGVIYKNTIGTYLHGPLLPKNPHLCDWILQKAIEKKDKKFKLTALDDTIEYAANDYIVNRFIKKRER
jgi:CobQ-like glutamine amidotransferase family enzyme